MARPNRPEIHEDVATSDERRTVERHKTVLRVAVLHHGSTTQLCLLRNVSTGGVQARLFSHLAAGTAVTLQLTEGELLDGKVAWCRPDGLAGISFVREQDFDELLDPARGCAGKRRRLPRVPVHRHAILRVGSSYSVVQIDDISQGGVSLTLTKPLAVLGVRAAVIKATGLPSLAGQIRWNADNRLGLSFNEPLGIDLLANWLSEFRGEPTR